MRRLFRCKQTCQWRGQLWHEGDMYDVAPEGIDPPAQFFVELYPEPTSEPVVAPDPVLSEDAAQEPPVEPEPEELKVEEEDLVAPSEPADAEQDAEEPEPEPEPVELASEKPAKAKTGVKK